jgi:hypothetical protein
MPNRHSAIYGPSGPDKTEVVKYLLDEDLMAHTESWVIDLDAKGVDGWYGRASWVVTDLVWARIMLDTTEDIDFAVTITIEGADQVLADESCRGLVEQAMSLEHVSVRLIVPDLTHRSFGGSAVIRAEIDRGSSYATALAVAS